MCTFKNLEEIRKTWKKRVATLNTCIDMLFVNKIEYMLIVFFP